MESSIKTTASQERIGKRKPRSPYKWHVSSQKLKDSLKEAWKNREHNGYGSKQKPTEETKRKTSESHKKRWQRIHQALKILEEMEEEE